MLLISRIVLKKEKKCSLNKRGLRHQRRKINDEREKVTFPLQESSHVTPPPVNPLTRDVSFQ